MTTRGIAVVSGSNTVIAKILEDGTAVFGVDKPIDLRISGTLELDLSGSTFPGYLYVNNQGIATLTSALIGNVSASTVAVAPSGNLSSTNVQTALEELQLNIDIFSSSIGNIPNSSLQNSSINLNGANLSLGSTGSVGIVREILAGNSLTVTSGSSSIATIALSSVVNGITNLSAINISSSNFTGNGANITNINTNNITNFTNDVRNQFAEGVGIQINGGGSINVSGAPNSSLLNSSINLNGVDISLGATGSVGITREIQAGANIQITNGTSATATVALSSSLSGLNSINATTISATTANFTTITASVISASSYIGISAGSTPGGINQSIQFNSGSTLSGTANLIYNYNTNVLSGTTAQFSIITSSFTGSGAGLFNLSASGINNFTADVRNQFSAGTSIVINSGVISASNIVNASLQNSSININGSNISLGATGSVGVVREIQAGSNIGITGGTSATASISLSSSLTGLTSVSATTITGSTITGSTALFTSITGSHSGSGAGLFNLTASNINNFATDVRSQFSAGTGIAINSGVISASSVPNSSLQNSSITIGTTNIALGGTSTVLAGITSLTASNAFFQGDVRINGTASIAFLQTINEQSLKIGDKYIFILSGAIDHTTLDGSGIQWGSGNVGDPTDDEFGSAAHVRYNGTKDKISIFPGLYVSGATGTEISGGLVVTGSTFVQTLSGTTAQFISITGAFSGNGAGITNIPNASLTNSSITIGSTSITLGNSATTIQGLTVITGSTITGSNALFTTITGSHSGSGAGLYNLTASGINNFTNDVRGQFSAGTNITIVAGVISSTASGSGGSGSGTPGGTNTTVQFNSGSTFSGSTNLIYNYTTNILSGTTAQFTNITASFTGSGVGLYNITASGINNFTADVRGQFSAGSNVSIVGGVISAAGGGGGNLTTLNVTTDYLLQSTDAYIFTSGTLTLTIPTAIGAAGKLYYIKNTSTDVVTLTGSLSQTIDGYTNMVIEDKNTMLGLASDGANWTIF